MILESEVSLLRVDVQLSQDGAPLTLTGPTVTNTTFTYTTQLNLTQESDYGNYTCTATIRPQPSAIYLTGIDKISSDTLAIEPGKFMLTIIVVTECVVTVILNTYSHSSSCWCSSYSIRFLCSSGGQLESSILSWTIQNHWI